MAVFNRKNVDLCYESTHNSYLFIHLFFNLACENSLVCQANFYLLLPAMVTSKLLAVWKLPICGDIGTEVNNRPTAICSHAGCRWRPNCGSFGDKPKLFISPMPSSYAPGYWMALKYPNASLPVTFQSIRGLISHQSSNLPFLLQQGPNPETRDSFHTFTHKKKKKTFMNKHLWTQRTHRLNQAQETRPKCQVLITESFDSQNEQTTLKST